MPNNANNSATRVNATVTDNISHPAIPFPTGDNPPPLAKQVPAPVAEQVVEQIKEKTAETVKPVAEKLTVLTEQAASKLNASASQAVAKLCEHSEKLYVSQAKLLDTCRVQVRKQPMTILGVAIATVVALGVLFHRQTR